MGQYFLGAILRKNHIKNMSPIKKSASPIMFDDMFKLLEHSYIGSNYVNYIVSLLGNECYGFPLVWAGEYADTINGKNYYNCAREYITAHNPKMPKDVDKLRYIINLSKKQYIDLGDYAKHNIHPLPLLACAGNGEGGNGDYTKGENLNMVGKWAFDCFGATNDTSKLEGLAKVYYEFKQD